MKPGDKVKVSRRPVKGEPYATAWDLLSFDQHLGKTGTLLKIVSYDNKSLALVKHNNEEVGYPLFCLEAHVCQCSSLQLFRQGCKC